MTEKDALFASVQEFSRNCRNVGLPVKFCISNLTTQKAVFSSLAIPNVFATSLTKDFGTTLLQEYSLSSSCTTQNDVYYVMKNGEYVNGVLDKLPTLKAFVERTPVQQQLFTTPFGNIYFQHYNRSRSDDGGGCTNCCVQLRFPMNMGSSSAVLASVEFFHATTSAPEVLEYKMFTPVLVDGTVPSTTTISSTTTTEFVMLVFELWHPHLLLDRRNKRCLTILFNHHTTTTFVDEDVLDLFNTGHASVLPMLVLSGAAAASDGLRIPFDAVRYVISMVATPPRIIITPPSDTLKQPIKFTMIGDSGVGKTIFSTRFHDNTFETAFVPTIGIDFKSNHVKMELGSNTYSARLQLWDVAGQQRFRALVQSYFRGAQGILLCFDVQSRSSFNNLDNWVGDLDRHFMIEGGPVVVVGMKADQGCTSREVTYEEGFEFADDYGYSYIECSAKDNYNLNEALGLLFQQVIPLLKLPPDPPMIPTTGEKKKTCCI
eukprot:PhF_6_TR30713/c0_g1_i2/m.45194